MALAYPPKPLEFAHRMSPPGPKIRGLDFLPWFLRQSLNQWSPGDLNGAGLNYGLCPSVWQRVTVGLAKTLFV